MFPEALTGVNFDDFFFAINDVRPSFIRVEADEVTYNLHIILRFEIERAFLNGDIKPSELPGLWNEKFEQFFGITPKNDADGCLQDVHWSHGSFGYFATYSIGSLYASQLFASISKENPGLREQIANGNNQPVFNWLKQHIYQFGRYYTSGELCQKATGENLKSQYFIDHATKKYSDIYTK